MARKPSTVCRISSSFGMSSTAASSAPVSPTITSSRASGSASRSSARVRMPEPTLPPQPAQRMSRPASAARVSASARPSGRSGGVSAAISGRIGEPFHEPAVDPVLPVPDPCAPGGKTAARGDGTLVAGADEAEEAALRTVGLQALTQQRMPEVLRQRPALPDGEDTGFRPGMIAHGRNIASAEDIRMRR